MTSSQSAVRRVRGPIRLGRGRLIALYVVAAGIWVSGCGWLVFHYFLRQQGEFGLETHPLEPWWLRLHGAFAFGAIWVFGMLAALHIANGWAAGRRRRSGGSMVALTAVLCVSGYLLYYLGHETARSFTAYLHWGLGLAAPLAFVWHRFFDKERAGGLSGGQAEDQLTGQRP